jgi:hypothetical protein
LGARCQHCNPGTAILRQYSRLQDLTEHGQRWRIKINQVTKVDSVLIEQGRAPPERVIRGPLAKDAPRVPLRACWSPLCEPRSQNNLRPECVFAQFRKFKWGRTALFFDSNACALKLAPCCFTLRNWGDTPIGRTGRCIVRNEWPVIPCLLFGLRMAGFFVPKTFISPSTTAPKNKLLRSSRARSSGGEKIVTDYLYATSECTRQTGIKTNASAFRHASKG